MNRYKANTLILSYKIGIGDGKYYVMVPEKKLDHTLMITHHGSYMIVKKGKRPVKRYFQSGKVDMYGEKIAPDFWGAYFLWEPYQTKPKQEEVKTIETLSKSLSLDRVRELKEIAIGLKKRPIEK